MTSIKKKLKNGRTVEVPRKKLLRNDVEKKIIIMILVIVED